jgi:hypothetical protein
VVSTFGVTTIDGVDSFGTNFTNAGGLANEAQGASGDSGGAVFYNNGGNWELAGMMHANTTYSGQPADTAVFNNATFAADIATYYDAIDVATDGSLTASPIPEPSTAIMTILGSSILFRRNRKQA